MKSSHVVFLLPLAATLACAGAQDIQKEQSGAQASPVSTPPAVGAEKEKAKAAPPKEAAPNPKPTPSGSKPTPVPCDQPSPCTQTPTPVDPGGYPGYPFMTCTVTVPNNFCAGKSYDTCSTVPVSLCPPADKYCRAVVAPDNTCITGETKACPGSSLISVCEVGPVNSTTGLSPCSWSKCKHCGAAGEPCCNPPTAACVAGKTCSLVSGAAFPTCN